MRPVHGSHVLATMSRSLETRGEQQGRTTLTKEPESHEYRWISSMEDGEETLSVQSP
jgi:hypothetical protein